MGRSGGGSNGGGGSGGFSGGGNIGGSGGFSGGHSGRPNRGGRSSPHPGGFPGGRSVPPPRRSAPPPRRQGGGIHTGPIFVNTSRPNYHDHNQRRGGGPQPPSNGGRGCGATILIVIAIVFLLSVVLVMMNSDETSSTIHREKLPASAVKESVYYMDKDGDWIANASELESGLRKFYQETGVQPYVYILPNGAETSTDRLSRQAETLYDQLFQDAGHFLLVFCDDGEGGYNCGYAYGAQARTVMDDEAIQILAENLNACYADSSLDEEEIFSVAFEDTAKRIMTVTKSPSQILAASMKPLAIVIVLISVIAVILKIVKSRREAREREQRRAEEILRTPLEKFGDAEAEELAKKYEDE